MHTTNVCTVCRPESLDLARGLTSGNMLPRAYTHYFSFKANMGSEDMIRQARIPSPPIRLACQRITTRIAWVPRTPCNLITHVSSPICLRQDMAGAKSVTGESEVYSHFGVGIVPSLLGVRLHMKHIKTRYHVPRKGCTCRKSHHLNNSLQLASGVKTSGYVRYYQVQINWICTCPG